MATTIHVETDPVSTLNKEPVLDQYTKCTPLRPSPPNWRHLWSTIVSFSLYEFGQSNGNITGDIPCKIMSARDERSTNLKDILAEEEFDYESDTVVR